MGATATKNQVISYWVKVFVVVYLMFGFGYLQPFGGISEIGMKVLGVFLGLLFGWIFVAIDWVSLLGLFALYFAGYMTINEIFAGSFGNSTTVFIIFLFIFTDIISKSGLTDYLGNWFVSRKMVAGKPWLFTTLYLLGAGITATLTNTIVAMVVFWQIFYAIAKKLGYKPFDRYPTFMVLGITLTSAFGAALLPFKVLPILLMNSYTSLSGETVNYGLYIAFMFTMFILMVIGYTLLGWFVLKLDTDKLKGINPDIVDTSKLVLTKKQKIVSVFLSIFILSLLVPSFFPEIAWLAKINGLGVAGITIFVLLLMMFVKVEGEPLYNFHETASRSIAWGVVFLAGAVVLISGAITNPETGIQPFIVDLLSPILAGHNVYLFTAIFAVIALLLANVANNLAMGIILVPISYPFISDMGISGIPILLLIIFCVNLPVLLPSASVNAAMMFSNEEWVNKKQMYSLLIPTLIYLIIFTIFIGNFLANLMF